MGRESVSAPVAPGLIFLHRQLFVVAASVFAAPVPPRAGCSRGSSDAWDLGQYRRRRKGSLHPGAQHPVCWNASGCRALRTRSPAHKLHKGHLKNMPESGCEGVPVSQAYTVQRAMASSLAASTLTEQSFPAFSGVLVESLQEQLSTSILRSSRR